MSRISGVNQLWPRIDESEIVTAMFDWTCVEAKPSVPAPFEASVIAPCALRIVAVEAAPMATLPSVVTSVSATVAEVVQLVVTTPTAASPTIPLSLAMPPDCSASMVA